MLVGAIAAEVIATMSLRATIDHAAWIPTVIIGYVTAFGLLGLLLRAGARIGAVYGIWGASGVALTAFLGALIFGELLSFPAVIGISCIIVGVFLVETGSYQTDRTLGTKTGP